MFLFLSVHFVQFRTELSSSSSVTVIDPSLSEDKSVRNSDRLKFFFSNFFWHILEFCAIFVQNFASKNTSAELNRCFEGLVQLAKVLSLFQQFKMDPSGFDPTEHQHRRWNPMTAQWILGNQATMFFHVGNQDLCLSVLTNVCYWPMTMLHRTSVPRCLI